MKTEQIYFILNSYSYIDFQFSLDPPFSGTCLANFPYRRNGGASLSASQSLTIEK